MKVSYRSLMCLVAAGLLAGMLGLAGCSSSSGSRTSGQKKSDSEVAKAVKKQLEKDPIYKYPNVEANVYQGTVQLGGFVQTPGQRQQAAEVAASVPGAHQVINGIMLQPTPTGPAPIRNQPAPEPGRLTNSNAPGSQPGTAPPTEATPQQPPGDQTSPKQ